MNVNIIITEEQKKVLIKETSSVFASSVTYLIPIVAIFWGVNDGESFGIYQGLLCGIILAGVYLIKSNKKSISFFTSHINSLTQHISRFLL